MEPNRDQKSSNFGQVEGRLTGRVSKLRIGNLNLSNVGAARAGVLAGEFFGIFDVMSHSMFTGTFNEESFNCSKKKFSGTVFEGRFVGYFKGFIKSDFLNPNMYILNGEFYGKLTGRFVGKLDNQLNEQFTTSNAVTQASYPLSTIYILPFRSIIPNPSDKKGVVNGKLYGEMRIDRETFDKLFDGMVQSPLQLDNLKGKINISCLAKFSGTFNDKEFVEAIRTFNGTVHNGLFNGQFRGFIEFCANMVCLSGTFSGNLVGNFVGSLDGVVSNRAVIV